MNERERENAKSQLKITSPAPGKEKFQVTASPGPLNHFPLQDSDGRALSSLILILSSRPQVK